MDKQIKKLFFILFVILLISGCGGIGGKKQPTPISEVNIRQGVEGIAMEFLKKAPPDRVFENSAFPIIIRLKNKGAYNVLDGYLTLSVEKDYLGNIKWDFREDFLRQSSSDELAFFTLEGKSISNPNGGEDLVSIVANSKRIEAQSETHDSLILATACYRYNTELGANVCIDTDIFGTRPAKKVCEIKDLAFNSGQGAPVAITKVETQILPADAPDKIRPQFLIHIENKGKGEVVHNERYRQACSGFDIKDEEGERTKFEDFNVVFVSAFLSDKQLDCSPSDETEEEEGKVKLKSEKSSKVRKAVARCILREGDAIEKAKDAYIAPLRIVVDYGYTESISRQVKIEKALKY